MAHNNWSAYTDDRRSSTARRDRDRESYRTGGERSQPANRRDSRDGRYANEPGNIRSPYENRTSREYRRDIESPRNNHESLSNPMGRLKLVSNNAAAGLPDKPGDGLEFNRINIASDKHIATSSSSTSASGTLFKPTAKNPKLQEAVENAYKWGEKYYSLIRIRIRRDKLALENQQHKQELEQFSKKAKNFPPYRECGLSDKFDEACRTVNDQVKVAENECLGALEQLVASLVNTSEPVAINHKDPNLAALEAKVERISVQAASQNEQLQSLLEENKSLSALKADHDEIQSQLRTCDDRIQALESQQKAMTAENTGLREQLQGLRSQSEENFKRHNTELEQLNKQSSHVAEVLNVSALDLDGRVTSIEKKLNDFNDYADIKEKVDAIDLSLLDEIFSAWGDKVWNLRTLLAEYEEHRDRTGCPVSETLQALDQAIKSLQESPIQAPPPQQKPHPSSDMLEEALDAKIEAAKKLIKQENEEFCQGRDDLIASLIDESGKRINALDTRVRSLEHAPQMEQSQEPDMAERVSLLEGGNTDSLIDQTKVDVSKLNRDYEALIHDVGQLPNREWVDGRLLELLDKLGVYPGLVNEAKEIQRKLSMLETGLITLDRLYHNINTKQLAECILKLMNPLFEQRLAKVEQKCISLEGKGIKNEKLLTRWVEGHQSLVELVHQLSGKRIASPGQLEEPSKKRKLGDINGRHPSPLQQQHTRNSTS